MATVGSPLIADPPGLWSGLGFAVTAGRCRVGETTVRLGAEGEGAAGSTGPIAVMAAEPDPARRPS